MEKQINIIQKLLENATVSPIEVDKIKNYQEELRSKLNHSMEILKKDDEKVDLLYMRINEATADLDSLKTKSDVIQSLAKDLKENATKLQEANVEGALNLTRAAWGRVTALDEENNQINNMITDTDRQIKRTEAMVKKI